MRGSRRRLLPSVKPPRPGSDGSARDGPNRRLPPPLPDLAAPSPREFEGTRADLDRWLSGDERAFDSLWRRYRPALEVLVAGRIRARLEERLRPRLDAEAEDLLQEAAITILAKLRGFEYRGPGTLLAWMSRIAENAVRDRVDYWRAGKRHPGAERISPAATRPTGSGIPSGLPHAGPGPATQADIAERRRRVAAALATLSERHHAIAFLRFFGGADWSEIAREVSSPSADAVRMECYGKVVPALAAALSKAAGQAGGGISPAPISPGPGIPLPPPR